MIVIVIVTMNEYEINKNGKIPIFCPLLMANTHQRGEAFAKSFRDMVPVFTPSFIFAEINSIQIANFSGLFGTLLVSRR